MKIKTLFLIFLIPIILQANPVKTVHHVIYVVDGDTIRIWYNGKKEYVRLIGIDTPESRRNSRAKRISKRTGKDLSVIIRQGKRAKKYMKSLVKPGDPIYLEFDIQERDHYRRLLGYVYLKNGKMLNIEMLKAGFAVPLTVPPCVKYAKVFLQEYRQARYEGKGLWE